MYRYTPSYLKTLVYMLQASEYHISDYCKWLMRTHDFRRVAHRRSLARTQKATLLLVCVSCISLACVGGGLLLIAAGVFESLWWFVLSGVILVIVTPWVTAFGVVIPLKIGEIVVQKPRERKMIAEATEQVAKHPAIKIAIAGSFGKTTFKETLATVIGAGKIVAATPGNMNTPLGTSTFVKRLTGNEEVIVFELGESHVGDVRELCAITHPDVGVITGINQAHLETFGSIDRTVATIFELADYLGDKPLYKNRQSELVADHIDPSDPLAYDATGVNGWQVNDVHISLEGITFQATKDDSQLQVESGLVGAHQIGPLIACIDIATRVGVGLDAIAAGLKNTTPFEHRMQPRNLHGAWIIDDTYNGNIQGVEAGLALLDAVDATRKIYVTPGLVEQGGDTASIHEHIGTLIAQTADVVVLMKNSVTPYIRAGLETAGFGGEVRIVDDPIAFYSSIDQFVASGDVVLMQNDWTDNYA